MWKVVSLAAISVSAALDELWFLGDLLGILCLSAVSFLFFFFGVFSSLALVFGSVVLGLAVEEALEGMRYCGWLMGFRRRCPLMNVFPPCAQTTYELPSFLFFRTVTSLSHLPFASASPFDSGL